MDLLAGAVDTHVHSAPDLVERKLDDVELARQARERGMAALVLKNHFFTTALRARLVEQQVPGIRVVGSIVLNQPMGGMNPWAVQGAAEAGAKVVWMPTFQAEHQLAFERRPGGTRHRAQLHVDGLDPPVKVFDADGKPTAATDAVLEIARDRGLLLATGHLSPEETERLVARAVEVGLKKLIVTHPELAVIAMPVGLQQRLAERGVYFERTYNVVGGASPLMTIDELAARIRAVGPASTVLATDFGQTANPPPAEGLAQYVRALLDQGFSESDVRRMASDNARSLLDV
jgi:Family of unknown function (DUF6282)